MITRDLELRRGDLKPDLTVDVVDEFGLVDFTSATAIRMIGVLNETVLFDRAGTSPELGVATMPWQIGDTDEPGTITVEVEAMWPGGKPQTFRTTNKVRVLPDLA